MNIVLVYKSVKYVVIVGGDLMKLVVKEYDDVMVWISFVKVNFELLWDFLVEGVKILMVLFYKDMVGGLLNL